MLGRATFRAVAAGERALEIDAKVSLDATNPDVVARGGRAAGALRQRRPGGDGVRIANRAERDRLLQGQRGQQWRQIMRWVSPSASRPAAIVAAVASSTPRSGGGKSCGVCHCQRGRRFEIVFRAVTNTNE